MMIIVIVATRSYYDSYSNNDNNNHNSIDNSIFSNKLIFPQIIIKRKFHYKQKSDKFTPASVAGIANISVTGRTNFQSSSP